MKRALLGALLTVVGAGHAHGEEFAWRTDLAEARKEAAEKGRPLLVVFR